MGVTAAVIGGGLVAGALGNWLGAKEQASAAEKAAELTTEQAKEAAQAAQEGAGGAIGGLDLEMPGIQQNLGSAYTGAASYLGAGLGQAREDLLTSGSLGAQSVAQGAQDALGSLYGGAASGIGYLGQAQTGAQDALQSGITGAQGALAPAMSGQGIGAYNVLGSQDRAGGLLDQGMYSGFEADPGYQFRKQQGEEAIMRAASAAGGRGGGATMKALADYNSGLASQEFASFANRRQAEFGAMSASDQQRAQLMLNQAGRTDAAGQQALQNQLAAGGQLAGLYGSAAGQSAAMQQGLGQAAAGMAYGAGQSAAGIQQGTGSTLADIYGRTGVQLSGTAAAAGSALAANEADYYKGLADLGWKYAGQEGNWIMSGAGAQAGMIPALAGANMAGVPYAGGGWTALGNLGTQAATLGAMYYGSQNAPAATPAA